jgi:hypothetical protein
MAVIINISASRRQGRNREGSSEAGVLAIGEQTSGREAGAQSFKLSLLRTLATQTGMTNQWLKDQGLVPVKELWANTCPPLEDPLPNYGPVISVNRQGEPVLSLSKETRTPGGVGRGS